jgi:hypothetical protein
MSARKPSITVTRTYRHEPDDCARALALLLKKPINKAAEPDSCNDAAIVRNTEEVSHVEQRPDRPSENTYPAALESAYPRTHKTRRHNSLLERGQ